MPAMQQMVDALDVCIVERDVYDLAKRFLDHQGRAVRDLRVAMQERDFERIRKTGHDLKGSAGAYGLNELSHLGTELEVAAGAQDGDLVEQLLTRLEDKLSHVELRVASSEQQMSATEFPVARKSKP
jgi:two-component system sensor histidine kinase/response regulator